MAAHSNPPAKTTRTKASRTKASGTGTARTSPSKAGGGSASRSQGQTAGAQLVDSLHGLVDELIKENRRLQRQVEKLSSGGSGTAAAGLERGLRAIQQRIERTLAAASGAPAPARRGAGSRSSGPGKTASAAKPAPRSRRKPDPSP